MADERDVTRPRGAASFARYDQTFPTLTAHEIDRMRRFGEVRRYKHDQPLFETGKAKPVIFATLKLAEAAEAHRLMESSAHIGKIVLTV